GRVAPHPRSASTSAATLPIVPLGPVRFSATVSNTGTADVTLPLAVQFFLLDGSGKTLEQVDTVLPPPIRAGKTGTVEGTLNIPLSTPGGATLEVGVRVNPGCVVPTQLCDASNLTTVKVQVGAIDLKVASIAPVSPLIGTLTGTLNVTINNVGEQASPATTGNLLVTSPLFGGTLKADIPALAPSGSIVIPIPLAALPNVSGSESFTATINPAPAGDVDTGDKTLTTTLPVLTAVDLRVNSLSNPSTLIEAQAGTINVSLTNLGATTSAATTGNLVLTGPSGAIGSANIPALGPGATTIVAVPITVPNAVGSTSFTASITPAVTDDIDSANDSKTQSLSISSAVDIQVVSISGTGLVEGQPASLTVTLKNLGLITSAATTNNLQISGPAGVLATASVPAITAGGTSTVSVPVTLPVAVGPTSFTAVLTTPAPLDLNPTNDTVTDSLTLAAAVALQPISLTSTGAFIENQSGTFNVTIQNNGAIASTATTNNLILTGPAGFSAIASVPSIAPGGTVTIPITATLPAVSGANTFTATINPKAPLDLTAGTESISTSFTITSSYVDLKMTAFSLRQTTGLLSGNVYGFSVTVQNNGDIASAGTDTLSCAATGPNFGGSVNLPLTTTSIGTLTAGGSNTFADSFT